MWTGLALVSLALLQSIQAAEILSIDGFTNCNNGSSAISVQKIKVSFDKSTSSVDFDVAGTNEQEQDVTATLIVTAYGMEVLSKSFDPCDEGTKVEQLCPGMR